MKRFLTMTLTCSMILSMLAACSSDTGTSSSGGSSGGSSSSSSGGGSSTNADGSMGDMSYTMMFQGAYSEYPADGGIAKPIILEAWENDLGITNTDYNVITVAGGDYQTKLNTMMSGGETPDLFAANTDEVQTLVLNGVIAPVDDLVAKMPAYQALLEVPGNMEKYDAYLIDGQHYALPSLALDGSINGPGLNGLIIRTDWLDNVGMKQPTTLDELYDVLYAFTYNDPDQNGSNDTYGYGGASGSVFSGIFGAFGIYVNGVNSWTEINGELVHSTTLPEAKEALALLQQWYSEGLIDPDKFVLEEKQVEDKFTAGQIGSYENTLWRANNSRVAWASSEPDATCEIILPMEGPNGDSGYPVNLVGGTPMVISQNAVDNKDIDRFLSILDWSCDIDGGLNLVTYGVEGEHYTYDEATDFIDVSLVPADVSMYGLGFSNPVRFLFVTDRRWIANTDPRADDLAVTNDDSTWITSGFSGTVPAMSDYPDLYNILWMEYMTKIITGSMSIDSFDEYVDKFYSQGGQELTDQVNEAWKA